MSKSENEDMSYLFSASALPRFPTIALFILHNYFIVVLYIKNKNHFKKEVLL